MRAQGWYHDPWSLHQDRWFSDGQATSLVRDQRVTSRDEPPPGDPPEPLDPVAETGVPGDLMRADAATSKDQSFGQREGIRAVLDGSGGMGVGFS